ncbi:hypothetical protein K6U19_08285 [Vibrio fluvialis]|uniref:hypothetical protein n=1 Tax=Vibrio fluvialis TaxID=676 RepID=UPI001EEA8697|nr:hypothetical protein [Vibrio fluvialis]MCG6341241.1 hypothetical protein [Vibrio fluvialis]
MTQALALGVSIVRLPLHTLQGYQLLLGSLCYEQCVCIIYLPNPSSSTCKYHIELPATSSVDCVSEQLNTMTLGLVDLPPTRTFSFSATWGTGGGKTY